MIHCFYHNHNVISNNKNYVTVQNGFDGGVLNRHTDEIKNLPYISQAADNINKNNETENDTKQSSKYCIEDYEHFTRQMEEEYCDFDNFFFFFRTVVQALMKYLPQIDDITHSMKNLNFYIPIVRQSQRTRKPNP